MNTTTAAHAARGKGSRRGLEPTSRTSGKMRAADGSTVHGTAKLQPPEVEKSRCSDWPRSWRKRSTLELSVWIQLGAASDRPDARTGMSARKH